MDSALVTLKSYYDPLEAEMARARLESAGIGAFLADTATLQQNWQWTNAIGGIRLQVPAADEEVARQILLDENPAAAVSESTTADESCGSLNVREKNAEHTALMVLYGLMFPPFLLYGLWLVLYTLVTPSSMRPLIRRKFILAVILDVALLMLWTAIIFVLMMRMLA